MWAWVFIFRLAAIKCVGELGCLPSTVAFVRSPSRYRLLASSVPCLPRSGNFWDPARESSTSSCSAFNCSASLEPSGTGALNSKVERLEVESPATMVEANPKASYSVIVHTWALKGLPSHNFGVYVYTIKLHGAFGKVAVWNILSAWTLSFLTS